MPLFLSFASPSLQCCRIRALLLSSSCKAPRNTSLFLSSSPTCSPEHVQLLVLGDTPLFFSTRDGGWFPVLRLLHQYPDMMPRLRADQGAIKFVLSGANIMCPGLTSPGATMHDEVRCCSFEPS